MLLKAAQGSGSLGTNVRGTGAGSLLCWASIGPARNKIATEITMALIAPPPITMDAGLADWLCHKEFSNASFEL
jgi:hypothetical protein